MVWGTQSSNKSSISEWGRIRRVLLCTAMPWPAPGTRLEFVPLAGATSKSDSCVSGKKLSDDCKKELASFKIDLGTNINMNLPLANACKDDSSKFCSAEDPNDPGAVLACLR